MRIGRFDEVSPTKQQRNAFDCGAPSLNRWLAQQAGQSLASRDAVTYLLLDDALPGDPIAGYFSLSSGSVSKQAAPEAMAERAPEPIPAIRMGRFAINRMHQGRGWGADLLREALLRAVAGGRHVGARVMLVDAIDEHAVAFYRHHGFRPSPIHPMQVVFDLRTIAASAGSDV